MFDIDYTNYLSVDNGKGLLLSRGDIEVLNRYKFDYHKYFSLSTLIFDIDNYLNNNIDDADDLEEVLIHLSETHYYKDINKW